MLLQYRIFGWKRKAFHCINKTAYTPYKQSVWTFWIIFFIALCRIMQIIQNHFFNFNSKFLACKSYTVLSQVYYSFFILLNIYTLYTRSFQSSAACSLPAKNIQAFSIKYKNDFDGLCY